MVPEWKINVMIWTSVLAVILSIGVNVYVKMTAPEEETVEKAQLVLEEDPAFEKAVAGLDTPEKVSTFIKENFTYDDKLLKSIQTPLDTFRRKAGVCRHFAAFGTWCLRNAGYDALNLTYWWLNNKGVKTGHTVCIVRSVKGEKPEFTVVVNSEKPGKITGPYSGIEQMLSDLVSFPVIKHTIEDTKTLIERNRGAFEKEHAQETPQE